MRHIGHAVASALHSYAVPSRLSPGALRAPRSPTEGPDVAMAIPGACRSPAGYGGSSRGAYPPPLVAVDGAGLAGWLNRTMPARSRRGRVGTPELGTPHAQRAVDRAEPAVPQLGAIPARAGSREAGRSQRVDIWDHPRVRGEQPAKVTRPSSAVGPSPRARGADRVPRQLLREVRTIPACAGRSLPDLQRGVGWRGHPLRPRPRCPAVSLRCGDRLLDQVRCYARPAVSRSMSNGAGR